MNKNIKIGIIAENPELNEAKLYCNALRENEFYIVEGVYSTNTEISKIFDCQKYNNYTELIKNKQINLVIIIAEPKSIYKLAIEALNAFKNIAIEYPFADDIQNIEELIKTSAQRKCNLYFCIPSLFYPPYCKVKELIKKREIGEIQTIRIKSSMNLYDEINRKLLLFKNTYEKLFLAYYLLGDIEKIFSYGFYSQNTYAPAMTIWKYKEPCKYGILETVFSTIPTFSVSFETNKNVNVEAIEISGTSGYLWLSNKKTNFQNIPTLQVYRKDKLYSFENLQDNWNEAYKGCINDSTSYFLKREKISTLCNSYNVLKVFHWTISTFKSSEEGKEISFT